MAYTLLPYEVPHLITLTLQSFIGKDFQRQFFNLHFIRMPIECSPIDFPQSEWKLGYLSL